MYPIRWCNLQIHHGAPSQKQLPVLAHSPSATTTARKLANCSKEAQVEISKLLHDDFYKAMRGHFIHS